MPTATRRVSKKKGKAKRDQAIARGTGASASRQVDRPNILEQALSGMASFVDAVMTPTGRARLEDSERSDYVPTAKRKMGKRHARSK